jgi:hypothetical protein
VISQFVCLTGEKRQANWRVRYEGTSVKVSEGRKYVKSEHSDGLSPKWQYSGGETSAAGGPVHEQSSVPFEGWFLRIVERPFGITFFDRWHALLASGKIDFITLVTPPSSN